jgi:sigma-B regulation protein RsbU (phosphoserine phosphatase)
MKTFHWEGPAEPDAAGEVGRDLRDWCVHAGLPTDLVQTVTLACDKAMANAIEHVDAGRDPGRLRIRASRDDEEVVVVMSDGPGGLGFAPTGELANESVVRTTAQGTTVELRWPIPALPPEPALPVAQEVEPGDEGVEDRLHGMEAITDTELARLDVDAMTQEMLVRVRELLGVDTATILLYDPASEFLLATASVGVEEEVRQGVRIPYGHGFAGTVAARAKPMVVDHVDATTVLNPLLWEAGLHTLLGVPMVAGGQITGVLHVGARDRRSFTEHDISLLQLAADRLALATRAHLSHAEHAAANALQRSLMPGRLPVVSGFDFAARYVPSATLGVGGDWYDVFGLPGNRIGLVIGDVSGHGLASAVVMGRLRSALRAYALDNDAPNVVLDKLDRKAHHFEAGAMATVAYGVIDLAENRLRFCLAGHLPPVLAVPGRPSRFVDAAPDPPIGFDLRTRQRRCHTVELPPGALVCCYTDGLVERRGRPLDQGMDALLRTVSADRAESVCATLMSRFVGSESLLDDVAVLVAHRAHA